MSTIEKSALTYPPTPRMPAAAAIAEDLGAVDAATSEAALDDDKTSFEASSARYYMRSYAADMDLLGVVKRLQKGKIYRPPFQRQYVWSPAKASRFIESYLLGLPVPMVFLARESEENPQLLIVDGLQRLLTLRKFFENELTLEYVQEEFIGKTFDMLDSSAQQLLEDSVIRVIIITQERPVEEQPSGLFMIFQRLNSGGVLLTNQEIRHGLYYGGFCKLLDELVELPAWRETLYAGASSPGERMREQELILRFFALYHGWKTYTEPLVDFLNGYLANNKDFEKYSEASRLDTLFTTTITLLREQAGREVFKFGNQFNAALFDALAVGTALAQHAGKLTKRLPEAIDALKQDRNFQKFCKSQHAGTSGKSSVQGRIKLAIQALSQ